MRIVRDAHELTRLFSDCARRESEAGVRFPHDCTSRNISRRRASRSSFRFLADNDRNVIHLGEARLLDSSGRHQEGAGRGALSGYGPSGLREEDGQSGGCARRRPVVGYFETSVRWNFSARQTTGSSLSSR